MHSSIPARPLPHLHIRPRTGRAPLSALPDLLRAAGYYLSDAELADLLEAVRGWGAAGAWMWQLLRAQSRHIGI